MALPDPRPGLVLRYDYLWNREAAAGQLHGKERPACLVAASDPSATPRFVVLLPITHAAPGKDTEAVQIPPKVRAHLGLDDQPCWVIVSEYNVDHWPTAGLALVPGTKDKFAYGFLPPGLFAQIKSLFLEVTERGAGLQTRR